MLQDQRKKKEVLHSLALALTLNDFANEPLQKATKVCGLLYLTYGSARHI